MRLESEINILFFLLIVWFNDIKSYNLYRLNVNIRIVFRIGCFELTLYFSLRNYNSISLNDWDTDFIYFWSLMLFWDIKAILFYFILLLKNNLNRDLNI